MCHQPRCEHVQPRAWCPCPWWRARRPSSDLCGRGSLRAASALPTRTRHAVLLAPHCPSGGVRGVASARVARLLHSVAQAQACCIVSHRRAVGHVWRAIGAPAARQGSEAPLGGVLARRWRSCISRALTHLWRSCEAGLWRALGADSRRRPLQPECV